MQIAVGQVALDLFHVGVETHRQHAVGFVEDQHLEMIEREGALEQMIEHAPRRADDDVRALFERVDLRAIAHAAIDGHGAQARVAAQIFRLPATPVGPVHAWGPGSAPGSDCARRVEPLQHGQQERAGLAAAGAGLDHHVARAKQIGDGPRLNRHEASSIWRAPAAALEWLGQLFQRHFGQWGHLVRQ